MNASEYEILYTRWSRKSSELIERAKKVMPGGDTRASAHYLPYPLFMTHGKGARIVDVEGRELLDFMNNFTSLIHGHAFGPAVEAISEQAQNGTAYAAPTVSQIELAELLVDRVHSLDSVRFTSSGTEATLMCIRCARAATGRQKILKMEGGYHGSYELAEVSLVPFPGQAGQIDRPVSLPVDASFPNSVLEDTIVAPLNRPDVALRLIESNAEDLAAVIVEPMLGSMGMVQATAEYLHTLRELTQMHGILLIFDEVITLRINEGGMQSIFGVKPDLTSMGKVIGGGMPAGAFGGRRDLMELFNPELKNPVMHASTFSGNPITMAAGLAAMKAFDQKAADRINALGDRLRSGIDQAFKRSGIAGRAIGAGSLTNILFSDVIPTDARGSLNAMISGGHIARLFHLGLLRHGVFCAGRLMFSISTPMDEADIDQAIWAVSETLVELKPVIEKERPALLL